MLTHLTLENFKAWRNADLSFGRVTGFFGTNSAGKSSLLQFLLMLKQTRNATDRGVVLDLGGEADLVSLGTFGDVIHHHDEKKGLEWSLDWTLPKELNLEDSGGPAMRGSQLRIQSSVYLSKQRLHCGALKYFFDDVDFCLTPRSNGAGSSNVQAARVPLGMENAQSFDLTSSGPEVDFLRTRGRPWPLPAPIKTHLFPNQVRHYYQNTDYLGDFELAYEELMDSLYYLGPLREHPRRDYHWAGSSPADVGLRGERTVDAILAATRDGNEQRLKPAGRGVKKWPFQKVIAHWLKKLKLIDSFSIAEIAPGTNLYRAMVKTPKSSVPTALPDIGFGVSQVLPALVLLYYVPDGATVLMEQPEIHLHPAVQSGLADLMLDVARVRNVQIIVESHSEHLLRRLQRRVAEGTASADDVRLYFVSSQRGCAKADDLQLNQYGEIESWPENFFGDEMGEIAAIAEASLNRKVGEST